MKQIKMSLACIPFWRCSAARLTLAGLLVLTWVLCGCSKKQSPSSEKTPVEVLSSSSTQPAPGMVPQPIQQTLRQPATVVQQDGQPDLRELNRCLVRWLIVNKRRPKNFDEFAATSGVPIPPPPAGKQYVIGRDMHIMLVNR